MKLGYKKPRNRQGPLRKVESISIVEIETHSGTLVLYEGEYGIVIMTKNQEKICILPGGSPEILLVDGNYEIVHESVIYGG